MREQGYYWVKFDEDEPEWIVCSWEPNAKDEMCWFNGNERVWCDPIEINETRILNPDER